MYYYLHISLKQGGLRCRSVEEHTGMENKIKRHPFLCAPYEEVKEWDKNSHGRRVTQL